MADVLTPEQRSRCMAAIRSRDTKPEMAVRRMVHAMGYRFRLHRSDLPGKPDLVLPRHEAVIFVHGCFWHLHNCRTGRVRPKTNAAFWRKKREGNRDRDRRHVRKLRRDGWRVLTVWECQLRDPAKVAERIGAFLEE